MNIGFVTRLDAFVHRGGDTVQLEQLAMALRAEGHRVDVHTGTRFQLDHRWDLVHIFNLQRPGETARQVCRAARSMPVVISPIYGDTTGLDAQGRSLMRRVLSRVAPPQLIELGKQGRRVARGLGELESIYPILARGPETLRRWVLGRCRGIYPNSGWEAEGLRRYIAPERVDNVEVVPNGVDIGLLERGWTADTFRQRWGIEYDKFILCVARFDERKNNLALVRAALQADVPCVMVGRPAPLHVGYYARCKREAGGSRRIRFIDEPLSQEQLTGAYRAAHVHALPSWLETPGLVSLEAALCGANLVLGECAPVREYFGESAWYCDPGDVTSIATALRSAYTMERNLYNIDDLVRRKYSWRQVALRQLECYERALETRGVMEVEAIYDHS